MAIEWVVNHLPTWRLLGFPVAGWVYQYRALSVGLRPASCLLSSVMASIRKRGIRVLCCCLDDCFIAAASP